MKHLVITLFTITFLFLLPIVVAAQCPTSGRYKNPNESKRKEGTIKYKLPETTKFYFKMDNSINSETYRAGDIVSFTVIEDIYAGFVDYLPRPKKKDDDEEDKVPYVGGDSVKVIPKDTKGYGRVNFSQRPTLFYARGKSKIYVVPEYIVLNNGQCLPIELPEVELDTLYFAENIKPCKYQERDLVIPSDKNNKRKRTIRKTDETLRNSDVKEKVKLVQCIQGRRPKVFNSGIAKAAAAGILAGLNDDNNSDRLSIGSLTVLSEGAGVDGIVDLLTGKNAEISSSLIFEAMLISSEGYIEHPPKKEEKKEK